MNEVEETLQRIKSHKNVGGYIILNGEGQVVRTTYQGDKKDEGDQIAKSYYQLALKAKNIIRDLDPINDLTFLRVKSKLNEVMIAPDKEFTLIVIQGQTTEKKEENE